MVVFMLRYEYEDEKNCNGDLMIAEMVSIYWAI